MSDLALKELQNRLRERSKLWQSNYNIHLAPLVAAATGNEPPITTDLLDDRRLLHDVRLRFYLRFPPIPLAQPLC